MKILISVMNLIFILAWYSFQHNTGLISLGRNKLKEFHEDLLRKSSWALLKFNRKNLIKIYVINVTSTVLILQHILVRVLYISCHQDNPHSLINRHNLISLVEEGKQFMEGYWSSSKVSLPPPTYSSVCTSAWRADPDCFSWTMGGTRSLC